MGGGVKRRGVGGGGGEEASLFARSMWGSQIWQMKLHRTAS